jgi:hypothetical protein
LALSERQYKDAHTQFSASVKAYQSINDDEQIAWSQAGLSQAMLGMGDTNDAQEILTDALWTAIELKAFIPLIFILPVSVLILNQSNTKLAKSVYLQIHSSPFITNSQFIKETIDPYLTIHNSIPEGTRALTQDQIIEKLWEAASSVMSNWMQLWIDDFNMDEDLSIQERKDHGTYN